MRYGQFSVTKKDLEELNRKGYKTFRTKTGKVVRFVMSSRKKTQTLFVYGSLRKGCYNNYMLKDEKYLGTTELEGYNLYSLGSYPAVNKGEGKIVVDVFEVKEKLSKDIHHMENQYGYEATKDCVVLNGQKIQGTIYTYKRRL